MEVTGKLYKKQDTQIVSDKFKKREFILEVPGQYPQYLMIQTTQDKVNLLDNFNEGDELKCHINLKGRLWENKCLNTIEAWKIEQTGAGEPII